MAVVLHSYGRNQYEQLSNVKGGSLYSKGIYEIIDVECFNERDLY